MIEEYLSDEEYEDYFPKLDNLRKKIAYALPVEQNMSILDLATGYGYFAIEIAKLEKNLKIIGIDISQNDVLNAKKNVKKYSCIEITQMNASKMSFSDGSFDIVVNFLGLEDIHMTRGKDGVYKTFHEVYRILKPEGYFCFVVMPPEEMETEAQKIEVEVFSYICNATWLSGREYENMLKEAGFTLISKTNYFTGKKLTPKQAKEEIEFACDNVPKIYGRKTPTFEEVWAKFGYGIEKNGMGHYSKTVLMIARKGYP